MSRSKIPIDRILNRRIVDERLHKENGQAKYETRRLDEYATEKRRHMDKMTDEQLYTALKLKGHDNHILDGTGRAAEYELIKRGLIRRS